MCALYAVSQIDAGVHGDGRPVRDLAADAGFRAALVAHETGERALCRLLVGQHTLHQQLRQHRSARKNRESVLFNADYLILIDKFLLLCIY